VLRRCSAVEDPTELEQLRRRLQLHRTTNSISWIDVPDAGQRARASERARSEELTRRRLRAAWSAAARRTRADGAMRPETARSSTPVLGEL